MSNSNSNMSPVVVAILVSLSILGTTGNSLVLYVYGRKKDKLTSTFFILILATTDFVTCLVIVPFTLIVEHFQSQLQHDLPCRLYHFLITSNIPFSCFVMVAIAFDRYFLICWPLKRIMTIERAKLTVLILATFAVSLGVIPTLSYGIISNEPSALSTIGDETNSSSLPSTVSFFVHQNTTTRSILFSLGDMSDDNDNSANDHDDIKQQQIALNQSILLQQEQNAAIVNSRKDTLAGVCAPIDTIVTDLVREVYRIIYATFFLVSIVLVSILYVLLFLTVRRRRLAKVKRSKQFEHATRGHKRADNAEVPDELADNESPTDSPNKLRDTVHRADANGENDIERLTPQPSTLPTNANANRQFKKISAKERQANIRTAIMLFVVTLVFIITFLPAFLMAYSLVYYNPIVFYLYFAYNVANPMIYCFMNEAFRLELINILRCTKQRERRRRRAT